MKILYVSQYFPPEPGAPAARVSELARRWVQAGHQVTVLTGFPNHPTGVVNPKYRTKFRRLICRELVDGIRVVRTWLLPLPNRKAHERMLNYASFWLSSCLTGSVLSRPDVIIATSPQLLVGLTGWWLSRIKRAPFILEVRDLWPDSITAAGIGNEASLVARFLRTLSRLLYWSSNHIVVVTPAFKDELVKKWNVCPEKISVVENGVEIDLFTPDGATDTVRSSLGLQGKFVVSYIGTLGLAHGLGTVLEAAARLQNTLPEVLFLLVGAGADRDRLVCLAQERSLANVRFLSHQPRGEVPSLIQSSDLCLVMLKKADVFRTVMPTKMLEFMACGRPVILGVDGHARRVMEEAEGGVFIEPEDVEALIRSITHLYHDANLRETLGRNGRQYVVEHLSREKTARMYSGVLDMVVLNRKGRS